MNQNQASNDGIGALQDALKTTFFFIRIAIALLCVAFLFSGIETIEKNEQAVVMRFGALRKTVDSNTNFLFAWPYPFESVRKVKAHSSRVITSESFLPYLSAAEKASNIKTAPPPSLTPGKDGYLLTRDFNILHCEASMRYQINDLPKYLFESADLKTQLKQLMDNAILRTVAGLTLNETQNQKTLTQSTLTALRQRISDLNLGIDIISIELKPSFPRQIENETLALNKATNQAANQRSEADLYSSKTLNEAQSEASAVLDQADISITDLTARSEALLKTYLELKQLYIKAPQMTKELLLREKMAEILTHLDALYLSDPDVDELRLQLPRRPLKKSSDKGDK